MKKIVVKGVCEKIDRNINYILALCKQSGNEVGLVGIICEDRDYNKIAGIPCVDENFADYDYVIDAIDTVTGKIEIVMQAEKAGTPVISSMGAGNKLDPTRFEVADIYKTSVCPLARVMRAELKKRGIKKLKCVYSKEPPVDIAIKMIDEEKNKVVPASISFVPSVAGLIIAGEVIKDIVYGNR